MRQESDCSHRATTSHFLPNLEFDQTAVSLLSQGATTALNPAPSPLGLGPSAALQIKPLTGDDTVVDALPSSTAQGVATMLRQRGLHWHDILHPLLLHARAGPWQLPRFEAGSA
jgi:hypothetical protein